MMKHILKLALSSLWLISVASAVAEGAVQSKHLAVAFSRNVPAFERFLVDSLGHGKLSENPLLPVTNTLAGLTFDGSRYSLNGKTIWTFTASEKTVMMRSDFAEGVTPPLFSLTFDQKKNHAMLLGLMKPEGQMALPCLLHLPDRGTLRITCNVPGATLDYDAGQVNPYILSRWDGRDEGGRGFACGSTGCGNVCILISTMRTA